MRNFSISKLYLRCVSRYAGSISFILAVFVTYALLPYIYSLDFYYTNFEIGAISWSGAQKLGDTFLSRIFFASFTISLIAFFYCIRKTTCTVSKIHEGRQLFLSLMFLLFMLGLFSSEIHPSNTLEWILVSITVVVFACSAFLNVQNSKRELIIYVGSFAVAFIAWCSYEAVLLLVSLINQSYPIKTELQYWFSIGVGGLFYLIAHIARMRNICIMLYKVLQIPVFLLFSTAFWRWEKTDSWHVDIIRAPGQVLLVVGLVLLVYYFYSWFRRPHNTESIESFLLNDPISVPTLIGVGVRSIFFPGSRFYILDLNDDFHLGEIVNPWQQMRDFHSFIPFDITARFPLLNILPSALNDVFFDGTLANLFWSYKLFTSAIMVSGVVFASELVSPLFALWVAVITPVMSSLFAHLMPLWLYFALLAKREKSCAFVLKSTVVSLLAFAWIPGTTASVFIAIAVFSCLILYYDYYRNPQQSFKESTKSCLGDFIWEIFPRRDNCIRNIFLFFLTVVSLPFVLQSAIILKSYAPAYLVEHSTPLNLTLSSSKFSVPETSSLVSSVYANTRVMPFGALFLSLVKQIDNVCVRNFDVSFPRILFEVSRFGGWIFGFLFVMICLLRYMQKYFSVKIKMAERECFDRAYIFFLLTILSFAWFINTYASVRIDASYITRCQHVSVLFGLFIIPTIVFYMLRVQKNWNFPIIASSIILGIYLPNFKPILYTILSRRHVVTHKDYIKQATKVGLPGIGSEGFLPVSDRIEEIEKVRDAVLEVHGASKEGFFEALNRPALYYYLGLKTPVADTGFFAVPAGEAQQRTIDAFELKAPKTILVYPSSNIDGITFPYRSYAIYRWLMKHKFLHGEQRGVYFFLKRGSPNDEFKFIRDALIRYDLGMLPAGWGRSISNLIDQIDLETECSLSDFSVGNTDKASNLSDKSLKYKLLPSERIINCRGRILDLLWLEVKADSSVGKLQGKLLWTKGKEKWSEERSVKFDIVPGNLLIPLSADPLWYTLVGSPRFILKISGTSSEYALQITKSSLFAIK